MIVRGQITMARKSNPELWGERAKASESKEEQSDD